MNNDGAIRSRIKTLSGLNSIFAAMQIIAASKLAKIKQRSQSARMYKEELWAAFSLVALPKGGGEKNKSGKIACILISGNRGLCGTFNQEIFFRADSFLSEHKEEKTDFFIFGRRGFDFLKARNRNIRETVFSDAPNLGTVVPLAQKLWKAFSDGEFDGVYLLHNHFYSLLQRKAVANRLLPPEQKEQSGVAAIIEADYEKVLYAKFEAELFSALCDSFLGEFSARIITLKAAIDNSKKIVDRLVLERNKARQLNITQQILEIVESSEAMKEEV